MGMKVKLEYIYQQSVVAVSQPAHKCIKVGQRQLRGGVSTPPLDIDSIIYLSESLQLKYIQFKLH